jgi:methionyl aminopeptidase
MSSPRDFIDDSDDYWRRDERTIKIHGPDGFAGMRLAGRLAAETLDFITPYVQPGVSTGELDKLCHDYILDHKAIPAPLGYRGYPKSICTSINHVVCHGIPSDKRLQDGDIVNIDVTTILDGWYGDTSRMFFAGEVGVKARRLCDVTYEAMMRGIAAAKPGGRVGDIGAAIQSYVEAQRFSVVRDFSGHGLGRIFHDAPNILHYGKAGTGPVLKPATSSSPPSSSTPSASPRPASSSSPSRPRGWPSRPTISPPRPKSRSRPSRPEGTASLPVTVGLVGPSSRVWTDVPKPKSGVPQRPSPPPATTRCAPFCRRV